MFMDVNHGQLLNKQGGQDATELVLQNNIRYSINI